VHSHLLGVLTHFCFLVNLNLPANTMAVNNEGPVGWG
jgi:hypothetical protein